MGSTVAEFVSAAAVSSAVVSSTAVPFSALSSAIISSTADTRAASDDDEEEDPDPGWGSDSYWSYSSGLDVPKGETYIPIGEDEAELRGHAKRAESRAAHELHVKHQQILDQIPRPQYKRGPRGNQTPSFYPNHSTWTPGLIPDLLSPPAERLASIAADIQRLEEREFSLRGQILAANAIEAALKM